MRYFLLMMIVATAAAGCLRMKVDPIEVKPITLNVNLRIDRELDDFFDFEEELAPAASTKATPASNPSAVIITTQPAAR